MEMIINARKNKYATYFLRVFFLLTLIILITFTITSCTKDVEDKEITVKINETEYKGLYTGTVEDNVPNGEGSFIYEKDEDYLKYSGTWENGTPAANGSLDTNLCIMNFGDLKRTGTYKGDTLDGVPSGNGTFEAITENNNRYIYEGSFLEGSFNGQGKRYFPDTSEYWIEEGNFENGFFFPTVYEYLKATGTYTDQEYTITEKSKKFIEEHENLFTKAKVKTSGLLDDKFSYAKYAKNQENYGDKLIRVRGLNVVQIFDDKIGDYETTHCILCDVYSNEVYYVQMPKKAKGIYQGDTVTLTALPLDFFTYPSVYETRVWAIACAGVSITK